MEQTKLSYYAKKQREIAIANGIHINDDVIDSWFGQQNNDYDIEEHEQYN